MKNKFTSFFKLGCALAPLLLGCIAPAAMAQTNVPPTPQSVLDTVKGYFTSFNTNLTWTNTALDLWTAANYQNQVNTSAEIGASYDAFRPSATTAISLEVVERNAGIAGTVVSSQAGMGLNLFHYDLKVTGYLDGGYANAFASTYAEFGARFKKKITDSTYVGVDIGYQHYFAKSVANQNSPTIGICAGFCF